MMHAQHLKSCLLMTRLADHLLLVVQIIMFVLVIMHVSVRLIFTVVLEVVAIVISGTVLAMK